MDAFEEPRRSGKRVLSLGDLAKAWSRSPEAVNARRNAKAVGVMRALLPATLMPRLRASGISAGVFTITADDHLAVHELRTVHQAPLLEALIAAGCGVTRIAVRVSPRQLNS